MRRDPRSAMQNGDHMRGQSTQLCTIVSLMCLLYKVTLAEWLRRVPAKYMGFPRKSSNLSYKTSSQVGIYSKPNDEWFRYVIAKYIECSSKI